MLWLRLYKVQMVNSENLNDKMVKSTIWYLVVLFTFMEVFVRTQITVRDTAPHDFIQNNNEVKYLVDDISTIHKEFSPGIKNGKIHDVHSNTFLRFEPDFLDFKERPLGVPHLEKVTLFNINNNKSIDMTSISGNTVHFHSSFFEDKKIPPMGNTTFNVVFLGREEGEIESNLYIHTSEGSYKFQVRGTSVASPYRLRPIIDIRVPLNSSFSPLIYMHNPHTEPIQIVEVYSSGGEFHLELPTGELEGPKGMWEIPPFQTKPIIRVRFNARTESNYTAYVRIKANGIKDVLVVPLEVEVSAQCGLHTPQGTIDFGVGGTLDKPKELKLLVYNTLKKPIRIQSISTTSKAIQVDYQPNVKILPEPNEPVAIATLYLDWKIAHETKDFFGKIIIKHKQGKSEIEIPYWATVFEGGLFYNASVTKYLTDKGSGDNGSRNFTVVNRYEYPLAITNISLPTEAHLYFSIKNFKSHILQPNESAVLFELTLKSDAVSSDLKLKTFLTIHTNISNVEVPLLSYNGKLTLILPGSNELILDLGLVGSEQTKESHFILLNSNPVEVRLVNLGRNIQSGSVEVVGCARGNEANDIHFPAANMSRCTHLKPGEYAVFRVSVESPRTEGQVVAQTFVQTQFERVTVAVRFRVAVGKLEIGPDRLVFDECFPGKVCTHPLRVHSTFAEPMVIESIASIPPDPRLSSSHSGHITARSTKIVGHLFLDPVLACRHHCYTGLPLNSSAGAHWLKSFSLPAATADLDLNLLNTFYGRYLNITATGGKWQNLTLRLDTTEVRGHLFHTRVKMTWPKLVVGPSAANRSVFVFPLTQIGNTSYKNITIRNPSNAVLTLQLVMDWAYPQVKNLFNHLPLAFTNGLEEPLDSDAFFFHETHNNARGEFTEEHDVYVHHKTVPLTIPARETVHVTIGFTATVTNLKSAFMFIRNNLTIIEMVKLTGQGAHPSFKFGNRKPGSILPLLFELTEKHLRDCEKEKNRKNPAPNLTVKRSFTARNTGDISVKVNAFYINRFPCEGYGFKVLNCEPFELAPNATRKIDIAFTPDFTLSKIHRTLILHTSLNVPVNYTLITTVPAYFLAPCGSVLPRPPWEPLLYYACISLMLFLLFIIVSVCFIESDRILRTSLQIREHVDTQPLDLRLIGTQTRTEVRSHNKPDPDNNDWHHSNGGIAANNHTPPLKATKEPDTGTIATNKSHAWNTEQNTKETLNHVFKFEGTITPPAPTAAASTSTTTITTTATTTTTAVPVQSKITKKKLSKKNSSEPPLEITNEHVKSKTWGSVFSRTNNNNNNLNTSSNNINNNNNSSSKKENQSSIGLNVASTTTTTTPSTPPPAPQPVTTTLTTATTNTTEGKKSPVVHNKVDVKKVSTIKNDLSTKKKINVPKKVKTPELPCSEEETSSTTTESSNNEEMEKFNESQMKQEKQLKKPVPNKKNKSPVAAGGANCDYRDNYEGDGEDEDFEKEPNINVTSNRWKARSEAAKQTKDTYEGKHPEAAAAARTAGALDYASRKNTQQKNRERKEKNSQKRRTAAEKCTNKNNAHQDLNNHHQHANNINHNNSNNNSGNNSGSGSNVRVSPPVPPLGAWGENRATFSDVVARSDSYYSTQVQQSIQRSVQQAHQLKPTLYVEPTQKQKEVKQNSAELGPIGSKKPEPLWNESAKPNYHLQPSSNPMQLSNSFFTEPQHQMPVVDNPNPYYDFPELWSAQESAMNNMFQNVRNEVQQIQEIPSLHTFHETWNQPSFWEPLCAPVGENRPQQNHPQVNAAPQAQPANDFLWNSAAPVSSVWSPAPSPWTPAEQLMETSAMPSVRSPPGFNRDETEMQRPQNFDPFTSFSNIWTPHNPDTWTYNPHNNHQ